MARITCDCGETLTNHLAPNDIQLVVYTRKEWEEICKCGTELMEKQDTDDIELLVYTDIEWENEICTGDIVEPSKIRPPHYSVWRCPKCERIMVYEGETLIRVYVLEKSRKKHKTK